MKRRLLPILMTLVLVCALPIWAAFVTSPDVTNPLVSTAGATSSEESAVDKLKLAISRGVDAQLTEDIEITQTLYVERSMTIDLNGHVLKMTGNSSVLRVKKDGPHPVTLTITDSRPQNPHGSYTGLPAGGVITGGKGTDAGGEYSLCWGSRIPGEWYNAEAGGRHAYRKQRQQHLYRWGDPCNVRRHDHRRNCRRT